MFFVLCASCFVLCLMKSFIFASLRLCARPFWSGSSGLGHRRIIPLKKSPKKTKPGLIPPLPALSETRPVLADIHALSPGDALKRVLDCPDPLHMVQSLPEGDFFWLIKKIGEDDCIPVLRLASEKQWQYLLDLELWDFDRLDLQQSFNWLRMLETADATSACRLASFKGPGTSVSLSFQQYPR